MKIRNGFVSNSSSSSFIISAETNKQGNIVMEMSPDTLGTVYKTIEEYKKYLIDECWCEGEYLTSRLDDVKHIFEAGKILIEKDVEYGAEEEFERMINNTLNVKVEII